MTNHTVTPAAVQAMIEALRKALPDLQAIYLFGSQASGDAGADMELYSLSPRDFARARRAAFTAMPSTGRL